MSKIEYTINKLAKLAKITSRTLRHYEEEGLIKPARKSNGYRIYGQDEVNRLQDILFYRELGIPISEIKRILEEPNYDREEVLNEHLKELTEKKKRLDSLINNLQKTIKTINGGYTMQDIEKFEGFKTKSIEENEKKYGKEVREKHGDETMDASNKKFQNMIKEEHEQLEELTEKLNETIKLATKEGDPNSELAKQMCSLHKQWITFFWPQYNKEMHLNLANMYVEDERFKAHYEKIEKGATEFLRDSLEIHI